jgi:hypothetical protein
LTQNTRDVLFLVVLIGFFQNERGHGGGNGPHWLADIQEAYKHEGSLLEIAKQSIWDSFQPMK